MRMVLIFVTMLLPYAAQASFWDRLVKGVHHTLEVVLNDPESAGEEGGASENARSSRGRVGGFLGQAVEYTSPEKLAEFAHRPVVGREREINEMLKMMTSSRKRNILIIGASGTGKTALVEGLAAAIQKSGLDKRIFSVSPLQLIESAFYRGSMEGRLQRLYKQAARIAGAIIFFDEIHGLVNLGVVSSQDRGNDASNLLKPLLLATDTTTIGATTWDEYRAHFNDQAFRRRFNLLFLDPPEGELLFEILETATDAEAGYIARENHVRFEVPAIEEAILQGRDIILENSPDRELDLLTNAAQHKELDVHSPLANQLARERRAVERELKKAAEIGGYFARHRMPELEIKREAILQREKKEIERWEALLAIQKEYRELSGQLQNRREANAASQLQPLTEKIEQLRSQFETLWPGHKLGVVTAADVRQAKLRRAMGPRRLSGLLSEGYERQRELETKLSKRVWGQEQAVGQVARGHTHYLQGFGAGDKRVAAVYAFCGGAGTGMTSLANALEEIAYGSHRPAFVLNLESSGGDPISLLTPFVTPLEPLFTELLKDPYRVVVIKNVSKASELALRQLTSVLKAGLAENSQKKSVDLRHVSFILELPDYAFGDVTVLTGQSLMSSLYFDGAEPNRLEALAELLEGAMNVPFKPHSPESLQRILDDPLQKLNDQLNPRTAGVWVELAPEARAFLAARAYKQNPGNPVKGMLREFERWVKEPVSRMSDQQALKRGDVLDVVFNGDGLELKARPGQCSNLMEEK